MWFAASWTKQNCGALQGHSLECARLLVIVRSLRKGGPEPFRDVGRLEDHAFALVAGAGAFAGEQSSARSMLEDLTYALVRLSRTLKVLVGTNFLADLLTLQTYC